jgi:predicted Zn-dependent protease
VLFDLRSRGRRRTVQGVYLGLAILMGGGLVLFGVGAGNGLGGLLNAFTNSGNSGAQSQVVSQQEKTAIKETQQNPSNPQAWHDLVEARWTTASQSPDYNANTLTFTAAGKKELALAVTAWTKYLGLTKSPDPNLAVLAARAYSGLGQYGNAANVWEIETGAEPSDAHGFECLAVSSYAAGQTRKGDLATDKALSLLPKASQAAMKTTLNSAKTTPATAKQYAASC